MIEPNGQKDYRFIENDEEQAPPPKLVDKLAEDIPSFEPTVKLVDHFELPYVH